MSIQSTSIKGYKSFRELDEFKLAPINVLIGANGSGKSNFVSVFELIQLVAADNQQNLNDWLDRKGGAHELAYRGPKETSNLNFRLWAGQGIHSFSLLVLDSGDVRLSSQSITSNSDGTNPSTFAEEIRRVAPEITKQMVFHFHDTGPGSPILKTSDIVNDRMLFKDGENLAPFLLNLKENHPAPYSNIRDTIRMVVPFFDDFDLVPHNGGNSIRLAWKEVGLQGTFGAHRLSDGTLRFICLTTLLLQPDPPPIIVIDEPELGLHPYALSVFAGLVKSASKRCQVVLATHSVELINEFEPQDIVVVDREDDQTVLKRIPDQLSKESLDSWMTDYSLGEIWMKNLVGGNP